MQTSPREARVLVSSAELIASCFPAMATAVSPAMADARSHFLAQAVRPVAKRDELLGYTRNNKTRQMGRQHSKSAAVAVKVCAATAAAI